MQDEEALEIFDCYRPSIGEAICLYVNTVIIETVLQVLSPQLLYSRVMDMADHHQAV